MGKKTLKQKRRTDEKRLHQHPSSVNQTREEHTQHPSTPAYSFTASYKAQVTTPVSSHQPHVTYVTQDLRKTVILSLSIVVFEIILYFLLHSHVLALPMIRY